MDAGEDTSPASRGSASPRSARPPCPAPIRPTPCSSAPCSSAPCSIGRSGTRLGHRRRHDGDTVWPNTSNHNSDSSIQVSQESERKYSDNSFQRRRIAGVTSGGERYASPLAKRPAAFFDNHAVIWSGEISTGDRRPESAVSTGESIGSPAVIAKAV